MHEYLDFAGRHWILFVALVIVLALIAFEEIKRHRGSAHQLEPGAAVQMLNRGALVLDCRKADDYVKGHIVGARNVPLSGLEARVEELKAKRNKPVLAVAATPGDTTRAAGVLRRAGFEAVYVLRGGLAAWRKENLPLERAEAERREPQRRRRAKKARGKK